MSVSQAGMFSIQEFADAGAPLASGRLYTYAFGTTTQKIAYTDAAGLVPHTYTLDASDVPYIALNSRGELPAPLYLLTDGSYDLALKRADGSAVWTRRADGAASAATVALYATSGGSALVGFLQAGTGAVSRTAQDKMRDAVSAFDFMTAAQIADVKAATKLVDVTAALQAAINYASGNSKTLFMPAGVYLITSPLVVGATSGSGTERSFGIFGQGPVATLGKGTDLWYAGSSTTAVLTFNKTADRHIHLEDFQIECASLNLATYGVLFSDITFSQHYVKRVSVSGAQTAFGVLKGTGANGEFTHFEDCNGANIERFYFQESTAGQAFEPIFVNCRANLKYTAAGTLFELGGSGGGFGMTVIDMNCSLVGVDPGFANRFQTTYLKLHGTSDNINIIGGRVEGISTILDQDTGPTQNANINFNGVTFAGMGSSAARPVINSTLNSTSGVTLTMDRCSIQLDVSSGTGDFIPSIGVSDGSRYIFDRCTFLSSVRISSALANVVNAGFEFRECIVRRVTTASGSIGSWRFNKVARYPGPDQIGRRAASSDNAFNAPGIPSNLLVNPDFGTTVGSNIVAPAPWVHFGTTGSFSTLQKAPTSTFSSSPNARGIGIPATSGVLQDVAGITFVSNVPVMYQGVFNFGIGSTGPVVFTLENSSTGFVYDEFKAQTNVALPVVVSLMAIPGNEGGNPRLRISNTGSAGATVNMHWQFVSQKNNAVFVAPAAGATKEFASPWGANVDTMRVHGRLAIPHKDDVTGSATTPQDAESDMYLSTVSERLNYFANAKWWEVPRQFASTVIPTTGTWVAGDRAFNSAPAVGSPKGWICTVGGTPGTWVSEGNL